MPEQNNNIWGNLPSSQAEALANLMRGGAYFLLEAANHFENVATNGTAQPINLPQAPSTDQVREEEKGAVELDCSSQISNHSSSGSEASPQVQPAPQTRDVNRMHYPNGNIHFIANPSDIKSNGIPHFAHCLRQFHTFRSKTTGETTRKWWCCGVMQCPVEGCLYLRKPYQSKSAKIGSPPNPPSGYDERKCQVHNQVLDWLPCSGGENNSPCIITATQKSNGETHVAHKGVHNHPFVPDYNPSPSARNQMENLIRTNPTAGAATLAMGNQFLPKPADQHEAWSNVDRIRDFRKKFLQTEGMRFATGANMQRFLELDMEYFVLDNYTRLFAKNEPNIITMQSPYMREVLQEATAGFQSDTIEGIIRDPNYYASTVDLHFTTGYDRITDRWVPVLISIIFGRTKQSYSQHWQALFNLAGERENITSWSDFQDHFSGVTCDWSQALGQSYLETLQDFAQTFPDGQNVSKEDCQPFYRVCSVHFKRSLNRVARNKTTVPADKKDELDKLIRELCNETRFTLFQDKVRKIVTSFNKLGGWLSWYLHKDRAPSFFPACQQFSEQQYTRFYKSLSSSTNAQESIGGVFQMYFTKPAKKKLSIDEAIQCSLDFAIEYEKKRNRAMKGLPDKWDSPRRGRRPRATNDGKPTERSFKVTRRSSSTKESTGTTRPSTNIPAEQIIVPVAEPPILTKGPDGTWHCHNGGNVPAVTAFGKFTGIPWNIPNVGINTCCLDCCQMALYLPLVANQLANPYNELRDRNSVLSRTFNLLDKRMFDEARFLWMEEVLKIDLGNIASAVDLDGDTSEFLDGNASRWCVIKESTETKYQKEILCSYEKHGGACMSSGHKLVNPEDPRAGSTPIDTIHMVFCPETHFKTLESTRVLDLPKMLDFTFGDKNYGQCKRNYIQSGMECNCIGNEIHEGPEVLVQYPTIMVLNMYGTQALLSDLNHSFYFWYKGRTWNIRSIILGDGNHFTCVFPVKTRSGDNAAIHRGWLHYDGIARNGAHFEFYELKNANYAMRGRAIDKMFVEPVRGTSVTAGETKPLNWDDLIVASNTLENTGHTFKKPPKPPIDATIVTTDQAIAQPAAASQTNGSNAITVEENTQEQLDVASQLTGLSKELQKRDKQVEISYKKVTKKRKKRDPRLSSGLRVGHSFKTDGLTRQKVCKGCNANIPAGTPCFCHSFRRTEGSSHIVTHHYHSRAFCLAKMKPADYQGFISIDWESHFCHSLEENDKRALIAISQLKRDRTLWREET